LDYSHSSSLNDLGSGQTLASVLGGTIHLNEFQDSRVVLSAGKSDATATITALSVVSLPRLGAFLMTNGQLCITWSTNASGYSLETSASLLLPSWDIDTNPPTILGDQFALIADTTAVQRFYRLHKQ
jgi:hypothetical protein